MAPHIVMCRFCKERFDAKKDRENIDWVQKSKGWYYHTSCYQKMRSEKDSTNDIWKDRIYDFIAHDLKVSYNYFLCEQQLINFVEKDRIGTYKGIYFALRYFYEIKHGDWNKGNGGLGIVPYIYKDSTDYWVAREEREKGILAGIEQQLKEKEASPVIKVKKRKSEKEKSKWNLEDI